MKEKKEISPCVKLGCSECCQNVTIRLFANEAEFLTLKDTVLIKQLKLFMEDGEI